MQSTQTTLQTDQDTERRKKEAKKSLRLRHHRIRSCEMGRNSRQSEETHNHSTPHQYRHANSNAVLVEKCNVFRKEYLQIKLFCCEHVHLV